MEIVIFLFLLLHSSHAVIYNLNDTEYNLMPPMVYLDDYNGCVQEPGGLFCTVEATLVSDTPSQLLTMIQEYSLQTTTHFNHSHLNYGLCIKKSCHKFYDETRDRRDVLEACLNESFWEKYQLKVKVADNYNCNTPKLYSDIDALDIFVAMLLLAILVMNLIGSLYDCYGVKGNENYKNIFLYFSIRRNWRRLMAPSGEGPEPRLRNLKAFNGIRAATMLYLINCHAVFPYLTYADNPRYIENLYDHIGLQPFFNGPLVTRIYFIISTFLLTYNLQLFSEKNEINWTLFPKEILRRIIRLTPTYVVVLAWSMTWQRFLGDGPYWHKAGILEMEHCRRDWWKNLLYINNYFDGSQCSILSWHLAVDMQLYCLTLIILICCRSARSKKLALLILFTIGIIFPALLIFFQDLSPFPLSTPTNIHNLFITDNTFNFIYKKGHTNLLNCAFGIGLGLIVYHCQQTNFDVKKYKRYRILFWAQPLLSIALVTMGYIFYAGGPKVSVAIRIMFSCLIMPLLSLVFTAFFWGLAMQLEELYRGVLGWRGGAPAARASLGACLAHAALVRVLAGRQTALLHASLDSFFKNGFYIIVLSYTVAFLLFVFVESPFSQLLKISRSTSKSTLQKNMDIATPLTAYDNDCNNTMELNLKTKTN